MARRQKAWLWLLLSSCLGVSLAVPAVAQPAALVRDIDPLRGGSFTDPRQLTAVGKKVFFTAQNPTDTGAANRELWVTDGTASGTEQLADACPGSCTANPQLLGTAGGLLYFAATGGDGRTQLWRSDGTRAGTFALTVDRGVGADLTTLGNLVLFLDCTSFGSCQVWRTDGSRQGTFPLQATGSQSYPSSPLGAVRLGGKAYFFLSGGSLELWRTDGSAAGTSRVTTLPGAFSSQLLTAAAGRLFFVADGPKGQALWTSDGTAGGTFPVTSFANSRPFQSDLWLLPYGGGVYFVADDLTHGNEIWASDGSVAGTRRATDFGFFDPFGNGSASGLAASQIADLGARLLFVASDGLTGSRLWSTTGAAVSTAPVTPAGLDMSSVVLAPVGGRAVFTLATGQAVELWASDGTAGGTGRLIDLCTGGCDTSAYSVTALGGAAYFLARDPAHGTELWTTDGTLAGTRRLTDLALDDPKVSLSDLATVGGRLYFPASDDEGDGIWTTDGQPGSTRRVSRVVAEGDSSHPRDLVAFGGRLLFTACDGDSRQLWASDGTDALRLSSIASEFTGCDSTDEPRNTVAAGDHVFFWTQLGPYVRPVLWASDGATVVRLGDFDESQGPPPVVAFGGEAYFPILTEGGASQLWKSDGTVPGTRKALDLPGLTSAAYQPTAIGGDLYFFGSTVDSGQLWRSDGTAGGTHPIWTGGIDASFPPLRAGSVIFFLASSEEGVEQLWKTDGTTAGTVKVADLPNLSLSLQPVIGAALAGRLYLFAQATGGPSAEVLWVSDGTAAGTSVVAGWPLALADPHPTVLGDRLFFVADDGLHGRELWSTDGTAGGTALFADLAPGAVAGDPTGLAAAGGRLFFSAYDGVHGYELWSSDGTPAGTRLAADVAPGEGSSSPAFLTAVGDRLYFAADDGEHGEELWSLPLAASGCQPSPAHLCLAGGRFQVEAEWRDFQGNIGRGTAVGLTGDTGYFWFFSPANVEVVAKVLDGRGVNGAFWVFYGALSSVEYTLTVTDTQTGLTRRYENPSGQLASVGDTAGFGPDGAFATKAAVRQRAAAAPAVSSRAVPAAAGGGPQTLAGCAATAARLCLNGGRFAVTAAWKDFQGHTGSGTAVALTGDTGYFWFFDPASVEVVAKVLDGRAVNGKFWLFYGALSSVEYTLTVTDTATGAHRTYTNASGDLASVADTDAF